MPKTLSRMSKREDCIITKTTPGQKSVIKTKEKGSIIKHLDEYHNNVVFYDIVGPNGLLIN